MSEAHSGNEALLTFKLSLHNQKILAGRLRVNGTFTTLQAFSIRSLAANIDMYSPFIFQFISFKCQERSSNSVLISRGGVLITLSTLFGTDLSSADASQLLKEGVDSFELPDAKKSCKACRKTHDTNMSSINALVNLISHNQLGTKLQYVDMSDIIDTNDSYSTSDFLIQFTKGNCTRSRTRRPLSKLAISKRVVMDYTPLLSGRHLLRGVR